MRIIKFRAWDEPSQSFIEDVTDISKARYYNQPLIQFTGLLDKNEKEIYEGDLMQLPHGGYEPRDIFEVKWDNENAKFIIVNKEGQWGIETRFVVIGNTYENKELLAKE